ncbi:MULTISPECIES: Wzz/FepE/Etk N-terminal domain-containing protein [unclassified Exiguobacterium]|uniref:YveK family protein n=1 Tax=unclassified Exiguobacterium TaxID=2644629 RepID=UPI001BE6E3D7
MRDINSSIQDTWFILKSKKWLILMTMILIGAIAYSLSRYVIPPTYEASTQILVVPKQNGTEALDSNQIQSSQGLINTYRIIMKSPIILNEVRENIPNAPENLEEQIVIESEENSQVITVRATAGSGEMAASIANELGLVFSSEIPSLMKVDNTQILSPSSVPIEPVEPNIPRNTAIGILLGFIFSSAFVLIRHLFNKQIRTEAEAEAILGIPVIASIPLFERQSFKTDKHNSHSSNQVKEGEKYVPKTQRKLS